MFDFFQKRPINVTMLLIVFVGSLVAGSAVNADTCTYREAIMALEKGNAIRGLVLMRMASRDGDRRAERYLLEQSVVAGLSALKVPVALMTASRLTK